MAIPPPNAGSALLGLNELRTADRWQIENRARELAQVVYLGHDVALCRILARYKFYVSANDIGFGAHIMLDGVWEPWITSFIAKRVEPGSTVVDVGANHGYYTLLLADLVGPAGRVAAVEPHPKTCELLRRSVDVNGFRSRTSIFECAVSSQDGELLHFFSPENEPKNARVVGNAPNSGGMTVLGSRLDTLLTEWPRIDFMKIDVEGAEEAAVDGAWTRIEKDRPDLLIEYSPLRCLDAPALLDRLEKIYPHFSVLNFDSQLEPANRDALLNIAHQEDWMLFLSIEE